MPEFILFMHGDSLVTNADTPAAWEAYLNGLQQAGVLRGGSAIGTGHCVRRAGEAPGISRQLVGYVKLEARDIGHARELVAGNPVYEAGGTVEIRELPVTG